MVAERCGPNLAIWIEGIAQGQGLEWAAQALANGGQQARGFAGSEDAPGRWALGPAHDGGSMDSCDQPQGPAGIDFAVVALAGAIDQRAARPDPLLQFPAEGFGIAQFGGAIGRHAPLGPLWLHGHVGGFAAKGEADAGFGELLLQQGGRGLADARGWVDGAGHGWLAPGDELVAGGAEHLGFDAPRERAFHSGWSREAARDGRGEVGFR